MAQSVKGFNPENVKRIYLGQPALVDGRPPTDVLSREQLDAVSLIADGLTYTEAAKELQIRQSTLSGRVNRAYGRLGISSSIQLAGFLPLDPDNPMLEDKKLQDLGLGDLRAVEGLSKGMDTDGVATKLKTTRNSVVSRLNYAATSKWPDCEVPTNVVRVANGLRAVYAQEFAKSGKATDKLLAGLALNKLVQYEPRIISLFDL
jgi:DNA-binding CsgD family transcriptional regulator